MGFLHFFYQIQLAII